MGQNRKRKKAVKTQESGAQTRKHRTESKAQQVTSEAGVK